MEGKQSIVILGAGFGGLGAAFLIAKKIKKLELRNKYEIVLIDRNDYHTFTPTLYEVATTSKTMANYPELKEIVTFPIAELIKGLPIKFIHDTVTDLDLTMGDLHCKNAKLKYDYLALALGAETNYFNIPGLKENALPFKTFAEALAVRNRIFNAVSEGKKQLKIVIGGGGSTGVELAGEIQEWLCELKEEVRECDSQITIVEAAPTILPGFLEKVIKLAQSRLKKLGTRILLNEVIGEVKPNKISLKSGRELPYDILIWTGGVKTSTLMSALPLKTEQKKHQVTTLESMECLPATSDLKLYGKIYAIGDAICFYNPETEKPIPKVARAAIIQASVVAENIIADIMAKEEVGDAIRHRVYKPIEYPYIIPIGGKYAVAKIGTLVFYGITAWWFKGLVELNYILSILPFWKGLKIWLKGLRIFIKNDRLG